MALPNTGRTTAAYQKSTLNYAFLHLTQVLLKVDYIFVVFVFLYVQDFHFFIHSIFVLMFILKVYDGLTKLSCVALDSAVTLPQDCRLCSTAVTVSRVTEAVGFFYVYTFTPFCLQQIGKVS